MSIKQQFKNYISEQIQSSSSYFVKANCARIETICRAFVNRSSYEFRCDDAQGQPSTYLIKDGKIIYIEKNPNAELGDGYGRLLYRSVFDKAQEILRDAKKNFVPIVPAEVVNQ